MPGVNHSESQTVLVKGSPTRKNRLSLRFFQKKETKRALDFAETPQPEEPKEEEKETEVSCDQVVPAAQISPPVCCTKKESLVPFVGLSNLGNTCYLNSVLQVLCYCPGFKNGVRQLCYTIAKKMEKEDKQAPENKEGAKDYFPASYEVICSLSALIESTELLQISYLLNPENYETELAAQPRRILNTLRELNPMYEGYLQHDAQEVLQCILGNVKEACQILKKEMKGLQVNETAPQDTSREPNGGEALAPSEETSTNNEMEGPKSEKRKSDNEVGNVKKKTRLTKEPAPQEQRVTRSKRKSAVEKLDEKADGPKTSVEPAPANHTQQKKSRLGLNWLKSSKQPSILSKFKSLSKADNSSKPSPAEQRTPSLKPDPDQVKNEEPAKENGSGGDSKTSQNETSQCDLVERLFQGQLAFRTRCLECEYLSERKEVFQDISVPVQENSPPQPEDSSDISPDPRQEMKSLQWAISQFASVERLVGDDKYFCENCNHYTEAERSLLFDKIPEIVTIHLKCFSANSLEFDYGGLSKINTPLLTPLQLSLSEWSTKPSRDVYGLFAVVMHNGVTISSGHYTAYVKLSDLGIKIDGVKSPSKPQELLKAEPLTEEEARAFDDGEVSFRTGANLPASGKVAKKTTDTVGLLGGQKSKLDYEQLPTPKPPKAEKVPSSLPEDKRLAGTNGNIHSQHDQRRQITAADGFSAESVICALQSLSEFEGKWLLFDDSEVKMMEEKDFLSTISPGAQSTSTPYLLFYKKMA
ncbi:ubiquitin carboxyl-terminal hydrolase 1 [Leptodactylus fuscus]|uniref:ubiquitin carboxyl-terminal hydrolase 1 n=1 Tax=Leptodactylus fuscus TaxID=238119 RepID=UPI003F4F0305